VPKGEDALPPYIVETLRSNPQCWSSACSIQGYHSQAIYNRPCPDLTLQSCVQVTNINNEGEISGGIELGQSLNCQQYRRDVANLPPPPPPPGTPPPPAPPGETNWTLIYIVIGILSFILLLGLVYFLFSRGSAQPVVYVPSASVSSTRSSVQPTQSVE